MGKQISLNLDGIKTEVINVKPVFARHETFHPRWSWIKKGFDAVEENPEIFVREDAPVRLGVGKNMVGSIRYWCNAFKVLFEDSPSEFGSSLLGNNGWDPFLETLQRYGFYIGTCSSQLVMRLLGILLSTFFDKQSFPSKSC